MVSSVSSSSSSRGFKPTTNDANKTREELENSLFESKFLAEYQGGCFGGSIGRRIFFGKIIGTILGKTFAFTLTKKFVQERITKYPVSATANAYNSYLSKQKRINENLIDAANENNIEKLNLAINDGAHVNGYANYQTALFVAAGAGHTNIVARLLTVHGIDVNAKNKKEWTALMYAAMRGHIEIVKLLAVPSIDVNAKDEEGKTAFMHAAEGGHIETMDRLRDFPNIDVNAKDEGGNTALSHAAKTVRNIKTVEYLLAVPEIDVNTKNHKGNTVLIQVVEWSWHWGTEMLKLLLAFPGIDVNAKNNKGHTALMLAAELENKKRSYNPTESPYGEIVNLILAVRGIDVNAKDEEGNTVLMQVAEWDVFRGTEMLKLLLDVPGIHVNAKNHKGHTALMLAAERAHTKFINNPTAKVFAEIVEVLLTVPSIDVNAKDEEGNTALSKISKGHYKTYIFEILSNKIKDIIERAAKIEPEKIQAKSFEKAIEKYDEYKSLNKLCDDAIDIITNKAINILKTNPNKLDLFPTETGFPNELVDIIFDYHTLSYQEAIRIIEGARPEFV